MQKPKIEWVSALGDPAVQYWRGNMCGDKNAVIGVETSSGQ